MPSREIYLPAPDGFPRYLRTWRPHGPARAAVVVVHGICEHGGRYVELAERFGRAGFLVGLPDLLGHGRSGGPRAHLERFEQLVDDVERVIETLLVGAPQLPVFLVGHSLGGTVAARVATAGRHTLAGLILSAAAVRVHDGLFPLLRKLAVVGSALLPRLRIVRMGSRYLSRDPAVVAEFEADPLVFHDRFTVRIGAEVLRAARQVEAQAARLTVPLLLLHGDQDVVVDLEGSQVLHSTCGAADKTLRIYPGAFHDLFHDPGWPERIAEVLAWVGARCGTAASVSRSYFPASSTSSSATEPKG